jgi:type IV pilus assembly protein PilE
MINFKKSHRGFTLIELMIVVAIVGILGAIAYPSYRDSVLKGRRAQARTALSELMQQQERYITQRNCYIAFSTNATTGAATAISPGSACGGVTATAVPFKTFSGENLGNSHYILSAEACPSGTGTLPISDCVRVVATPKASDPAAGALQLTSTGIKSCTGTDTRLCWP